MSHFPFLIQILSAVYFFVSAVSTEVSYFRKIRRFSTHRETFLPSKKRIVNKSPTMETISDAEQQGSFESETDIPERLIEASFRPAFKEMVSCESSKRMNLFWYHKLQWFVYDITLNLSFTFTIFALINAPQAIFVGKPAGRLLRLNTYGLTSAFMAVDFCINCVPIRLLHFLYPMSLSIIYFVVSVVYTERYGQNVQLFAEMRCEGGSCLKQMAFALGVCSPLVQLILSSLYGAKNHIVLRLSKKRYTPTEQTMKSGPSRKISRASRASDSTAMTTLESYKTYTQKERVQEEQGNRVTDGNRLTHLMQ